MPIPIEALNSILKGKNMTLPNGGGTYNTANTTPMTMGQAVQAPVPAPTQMPVFAQPAPTPQAPVTQTSPATVGSSPSTPAPAYTSTPITQTEQPVSEASGFDPLKAYRDLAIEQAMNSSQGTGIYALQKGIQYSPDQIMAQRKSADQLYNQALSEYANLADSYLANQKTKQSAVPLSDMSSSPWLEGLRINGLVQGGSMDERKQNLAYLAGLPADRQKALVKSGLYNSMSTGERQKFDSYDEVVSGTQQIASMLPADIETNPYKYVADKYSVFLGGKGTKPYQDFEAVLGRITAPIINNIYGAAVTGSELARAQTFIPDLAIDSTQRVGEKLKNLAAFAEFANDSALAKKAGMPKPSLDEYIKKYEGVTDGTYNKSKTGGFAEEW